jgi:fused signal recognition particle receptor
MFWRRRDEAAPDEAVPDEPAATGPGQEDIAVSGGPDERTGGDRADAARSDAANEPREPAARPGTGPAARAAAPEPVPITFGGPAESGGWTAEAMAAATAPSRSGFMSRLHGALRAGADDDETWEAVEEALIAGDVGARLAAEVVTRARARRDQVDPEAAVRTELSALLPPAAGAWQPRRPPAGGPAVILVVGVNGTGKTTSIAKLAARFRGQDQRVLLAAADTFRAAAIEQLSEWARRLDVPVVAHKAGADPSAVVYDALDAAAARGTDIVIVDTAGRLHTRHNLMEELTKIRRTIERRLPGADPEVLFVLDATTGQNGLAQAKAFHDAAGLTGIILAKLDSTAKGGIVFAIERALGIPVVFAGVGERARDLVEFDPAAFVDALFG